MMEAEKKITKKELLLEINTKEELEKVNELQLNYANTSSDEEIPSPTESELLHATFDSTPFSGIYQVGQDIVNTQQDDYPLLEKYIKSDTLDLIKQMKPENLGESSEVKSAVRTLNQTLRAIYFDSGDTDTLEFRVYKKVKSYIKSLKIEDIEAIENITGSIGCQNILKLTIMANCGSLEGYDLIAKIATEFFDNDSITTQILQTTFEEKTSEELKVETAEKNTQELAKLKSSVENIQANLWKLPGAVALWKSLPISTRRGLQFVAVGSLVVLGKHGFDIVQDTFSSGSSNKTDTSEQSLSKIVTINKTHESKPGNIKELIGIVLKFFFEK